MYQLNVFLKYLLQSSKKKLRGDRTGRKECKIICSCKRYIGRYGQARTPKSNAVNTYALVKNELKY